MTSPIIREEIIGDCRLILGDSAEVLPLLGKVDACVTDPPYGIGADEKASKNNGRHGWKYYGDTAWDRSRPPPCPF
jgi:DNA modification methylase